MDSRTMDELASLASDEKTFWSGLLMKWFVNTQKRIADQTGSQYGSQKKI